MHCFYQLKKKPQKTENFKIIFNVNVMTFLITIYLAHKKCKMFIALGQTMYNYYLV